MGGNLSAPSQPNPSPSTATSISAMSASSSTHQPKTQAEATQKPSEPELKISNQESSDPPKSTDTAKIPENSAEKEKTSGRYSQESNNLVPGASGTKDESVEDKFLEEKNTEKSTNEGDNDDEEGEEEEEGECGFCLFMKGGGCKETFIDWEKCVEEGEKNDEDIVEKCFQVTSALKKCMEAHSDYYAPLLQAEKAAEEEAAKQLEEEKQRLSNQQKDDGDPGKQEKEEALAHSEQKKES